MAIDVGQAEVQGVFQRHRVRYEVGPYYVLFEQRPPGAPSVSQTMHAGFDVDLFGTLDKMEVPRLLREEADIVFDYLADVAREVQSQVGQGCTVEIIGYPIRWCSIATFSLKRWCGFGSAIPGAWVNRRVRQKNRL